jgi:hypothetical protein
MGWAGGFFVAAPRGKETREQTRASHRTYRWKWDRDLENIVRE